MLFGLAAILAMLPPQAVPAVPGGCTAPAAENVGKPGCYLSSELAIDKPPKVVYWHIVPAADEAEARRNARGMRWSRIVRAHDRWWLHILSERDGPLGMPAHAVVGPLRPPTGDKLVARFMESWFPPGMRTRVHRHSGPEAFYVIDGEQCTETPAERRLIRPGESYVVPGGPHLQAAPRGRRSLVLILAPPGEPWMRLADDWTGSDFCAG